MHTESCGLNFKVRQRHALEDTQLAHLAGEGTSVRGAGGSQEPLLHGDQGQHHAAVELVAFQIGMALGVDGDITVVTTVGLQNTTTLAVAYTHASELHCVTSLAGEFSFPDPRRMTSYPGLCQDDSGQLSAFVSYSPAGAWEQVIVEWDAATATWAKGATFTGQGQPLNSNLIAGCP